VNPLTEHTTIAPEPTPDRPPAAHPAPRLLLCDHRGEGADALLAALEAAGHAVELSRSLRASLEHIARAAPDAILLDPLAGGTALELEALEEALARAKRRVPVLVLVDSASGPALARAGERGLFDVLHRDAPAEWLLLRLAQLQRQAERTRELDEMRYRAAHDDRTDLLRPHNFSVRLREHFSAAQRHKFDLALMIIDLDKFGQINKRHDHTVGDALITKVGAAIRKELRTEDVAGRLGGDEFAVLLPYTSPSDAANVVQRLVDKIRETSGPIPGAGEPVETGASIGFETYNGKTQDLPDVDVLRRHAERALRFAKRSGGNRGVYYRTLGEEER
jgi:diguanylate cyclase (GGDEF)-like protein